MRNNAIDVFDNLPKLEMSLPIDVKETLVYIAGYVIHKDVPVEDTLHYFNKFGNFTEEMSRGGLAVPYDSICQFVFFSYILFHEMKHDVCRTSLCNALMVTSNVYSLNVKTWTYFIKYINKQLYSYVQTLFLQGRISKITETFHKTSIDMIIQVVIVSISFLYI